MKPLLPLPLLLLFPLLFALPFCTRRPPVDPTFLKSEAGKAANDFYRALNNGNFDEAGLFFSRKLRNLYPDPTSYPLFEELRSGKIDQLFPGEGKVNLRDRSVLFEVAIQKGVVSGNSPPVLVTIRKETHRFIWENDNWYFDGAIDR